MAGYVMKMNTLVPNINQRGQKELSFEVRHKAYASRYAKFWSWLIADLTYFKNMAKKILIIFTILLISFRQNYGQELKKEYQKLVSNFIDYIKADNKEKVADLVAFPFKKEYPIPSIKNKQEFIHRYKEIFDDSVKQIIIKSNPATDWTEMGWRGIMLNQGDIWLDIDGRLLGVNCQSKFEKKLQNKLIAEDKNSIYPSLSKFYLPICILETSKFRIRIDELDNYKFRYASWALNKPMSSKPDLVLYNGQYIPYGTGGNHSYQFKNGEYIYKCFISVMREEDAPPAILTILKGNKEILNQNATIIEK